jgi:ammonium transporter, Amt family
VSGCVGGLVAITPAAGFVSPMSSIVIGLAAGAACYGGVLLKWRLRYDDSLDVVGVHGVGGTLGALATGVFASTLVNPAGANGLLFGNPSQLFVQWIGVAATWVYSFGVSYLLLRLIGHFWGVRVSPEEEDVGLDLSQHSEAGYSF